MDLHSDKSHVIFGLLVFTVIETSATNGLILSRRDLKLHVQYNLFLEK